MICNKSEDMDLLIPYIDKPVYIKGHCWNKKFDGWTVIYEGEESRLIGRNLLFDYKGKTYPVYGFLPSRHTMKTSSVYNNAIYDNDVNK